MRWPFSKKATSNKEEARRFYNAKDYEKAEPFLDAMLKENPNDTWAMDVLSRLYMNTGRHGKAVVLLSRILRERPEPALMRRIVKAGCNSKQLDVVMEQAELIEWTAKDEDLLLKIYDSFWPNERCVIFFHHTDWDPKLQFTSYLRAAYLFENGEIHASHDMVDKLVSAPIKSDATLVVALKVCESLGFQERADALFDEHFKTDLDASRKRSLAKKLRHAKRYEKSLRVAQLVLEENPNDEQMLTLVTELATKVDSPTVGINAFHTLDSLGEAKTFHVRRYANAAIAQGSANDIIHAVQRLVSLKVDASSTIRRAYLELSQMQATSGAEEILGLLKETPLEIELRSSAALEEGQLERALGVIDLGLKKFPDEILLLHRKAHILRSIGDIRGSIDVCEAILSINPRHLKAAILRTQLGTKIWDEAEAVKQYERMIETFPDCIKFHHQLLNYSYSAKRDMVWCKDIVEHGLTHVPNDLRLKLYKSLVHAHLGERALSQDTMKEILRAHPNNDKALITAAQVEKEIGNLDGQLAYVNRLLEKQRLSPLISKEGGKISPEYLGGDPLPAPSSIGRVSVIMTTYKRDPLLEVAIDSILNQTYADLELIVVDDCSPDDNFSYLEQRAAEEPKLRVFQMGQNGGTYLAKNFGMQQAKGDFLAFMDSDDYAHPQKIERQLDTMHQNPTLKGVVHRCIRIDESSNIEFRGVGPFRMSCISLLIRKEVVERMGYFDSLRVGADTEFIERIDAVFGKGSLMEAPELTMFMMRHSTSLTGGGPFHISWRSVAGPRLMHHTNFRIWHQQIAQKRSEGYMPQYISQRPFAVDESQKSTHYEWKEGMPLFSQRIQSRHARWWSGQQDVWQKALSAKLSGRAYVEGLGLKVPELYWSGSDVEGLPEFSILPSKFVLKPEEGWSSKNVYCMVNGDDILTHQPLSRDDIVEHLKSDDFYLQKKPEIMIEELLTPEDKSADDVLPRDYKFYCFGEKIVLIHVALRRSEINKEQNEHHYLKPNFVPFGEKVMKHRKQSKTPLERPDCWEEMIEAVRTIGKAVGIYMRIDMFATNRGAVFGEFTPTPHGGKGYSDVVDKYLAGFWHGEEGVE